MIDLHIYYSAETASVRGRSFIGSALAVDLPSDSEVNQQTTGYAGVISIALASRKIPPMLS
jgi:hypothetical protein